MNTVSWQPLSNETNQDLTSLELNVLQTESFDPDTSSLSKNRYYWRIPPRPLNHVTVGEILAVPYLPEARIVSARLVDGKLPTGVVLFPNGFLIVESIDIEVGNYPIVIETIDEKESKVTTSFSIKFLNTCDWTDTHAMYKIEQKKVDLLSEGDVLAVPFDKNGPIKAAKWVIGSLPPGTRLTTDGKIVVENKKMLIPDTYSPGIVTIDAQGGVTFFVVSVSISNDSIEHRVN
uniref:Uncharacterized protein n=1 Tax=Roseihalotalea indica TaxID=2867963 RepID=A0AA49GLM1_9BACT|nr:hypothetical protein K4G66_18935 [Tunicatimonas sp. TK19036]